MVCSCSALQGVGRIGVAQQAARRTRASAMAVLSTGAAEELPPTAGASIVAGIEAWLRNDT